VIVGDVEQADAFLIYSHLLQNKLESRLRILRKKRIRRDAVRRYMG
jgi:hypothetical protein